MTHLRKASSFLTVQSNQRQLTRINETISHVTIYEGKYHQVKRMFHAIENEVLELKRLKIANLALDENLKSGEYKLLSDKELKLLQRLTKEKVFNMAKTTGLFRIIVGVCRKAVVLSRKESRDKLKEQYNKYKEDPEGYKENARGLASQLSSKANETIQEVRNNPQDYANRLKRSKIILEEEKSKFTNLDANKEDSLEEGKFDDEGGATVNNNLRVVTEEDLKKNNNALEDKD